MRPRSGAGGDEQQQPGARNGAPPLDLLPVSPIEENPTTLGDHNKPPTDAAPARDAVASPRDEVELATRVSASESDHGAIAGDMDLDLALRQDRRDLRAALAVFRREERTEARARYNDMMALVSSLSHRGRKFRREATGRLRAIVSEIDSALRVIATASDSPG